MRPRPSPIEPEEIFLDARHEGAGLPLAGMGYLEPAIRAPALGGVWLLAVSMLAVLILTSVRVTLGEGAVSRRQAAENRLRTFSYGSARGAIRDRSGEFLATLKPRLTLVVFPSLLPRNESEYAALWERLQKVLGGPPELFDHLARVGRETREPFRLALPLDLEAASLMGEESSVFPGVIALEEGERVYPKGAAFSHALGFVRRDEARERGQAGLELAYDAELKGRQGVRVWEHDARGGARRLVELKNPQPGSTVTLALDAGLQEKSFEVVTKMLRTLGLRRAALVALDPRNGEVLALLSLPAIAPDEFTQGLSPEEFAALRDDPDRPFFNRAISGLYAPGSTIKPFLAVAALDADIIDPRETIFVTGAIEVASATNPNERYTFRDWRAHGAVDMTAAIAVSSNVYFYTIGGGYGSRPGLGIERMEAALKRFGFSGKLGIDIAGEADGRVPTPHWKEEVKGERWYIGDTYHTAIGQGDVLVTPLQLAAATAVLANRGTLWQPQLVRSVNAQNTQRAVTPRVLGEQIFPPNTFAVPRRGMRQAVETGSSRLLADLAIPAAGKTGTAETGHGTAHAWFTGFAPYDNPEIVLTLVVEDGGEGSTVAVPIAKDIFKWWAENRSERNL